jgi:dihydrofolate reductase
MAKKPIIVMIAAVGTMPNNEKVIGDGDRLPWHLPRDLRFFRRVTLNHTVIMGRKTYESFGKRPLPKRNNIVITRNKNYVAEGCSVCHSIEQALELSKDKEKVYIIGGGEIYKQAKEFADEILLTEIIDENHNDNLFPLFHGTVFFPEIDESEWKLVRPGKKKFLASNKFPITKQKSKVSQRALYFRVVGYKRKKL